MNKKALSLLVPLTVLIVPVRAYASNPLLLNGSDSIVPEACRSLCPCGVGGALQFVQNIMNVMISAAVIFMIMFIVWAGFLFIMSVANPESRSKARSMLINAVIGMVIVLAAWLIVDFVMKQLYGEGAFGPWNQILQVDGNTCIDPQTLIPIGGLGDVTGAIVNNGILGTSGGPGGGGPTSTGGSNCPAANPASMVAFPSNVVSGGSGIATSQTVQNFLAMRDAATKNGITLKVSSAYRSEAQQVSLWNQLGQDTSRVAKPCSLGGGGSNHNSGIAIDIDGSTVGSKIYTWLKANGGQFNFYNNLSNVDPYHWSPSGR